LLAIATRDPLRNLLLGVDSVWLEAECSRYEFFNDVVKQCTPDIAVVALDADHGKAMQLIHQLVAEFPKMPILAVSATSSIAGQVDGILVIGRAGAPRNVLGC
jgi:pilus assembly protein CpaE